MDFSGVGADGRMHACKQAGRQAGRQADRQAGMWGYIFFLVFFRSLNFAVTNESLRICFSSRVLAAGGTHNGAAGRYYLY